MIINYVDNLLAEYIGLNGFELIVVVSLLILIITDFIKMFKSQEFFLKGRLKFNDCNRSAPFPSMLVIYRKE